MPTHITAESSSSEGLHPDNEAENFEEELQNVSCEEEDPPNEAGGIPKEALDLLESKWQEWHDAEKDKRKPLWKALKTDLKSLPCHKALQGEAWSKKANMYHKWLQNKGQVRPHRRGLQLGRMWTARRILEESYKKDVIQMVKDQNEGQYLLECYQPTLNEVLQGVTAEEKAEAERQAKQWNEDGGPSEAQTRFTKKNIYTVMKNFADEMWKKGRVRMVILAGWKDDSNGEIFSTVNDFNPDIANGPMFKRRKDVEAYFDPYVRKCFGTDGRDSGDGSEHDSEGNEAGPATVKSHGRKKIDREEHVRKVIGEDGSIRLPEFDEGDRVEMQSLVRGFLTAHYRRACGNPKATVPFTKLSDFRPEDEIVELNDIPFGWEIPRDPSKMAKKKARRFLNHVQKHQSEHGEEAFKFKKWVDVAGRLHRNVEDPEYNPTRVVTTQGWARPRPRMKVQKVDSDDSDSREGDSDEQAEPGASRPQVRAGNAVSGEYTSDDTDDDDQSRSDPKGKGKAKLTSDRTGAPRGQVGGYRNPAQIQTNMASNPSGMSLKPAIRRPYGSRSDVIARTIEPEYSDDDDLDVEKIQKSLGDTQPSEDDREQDFMLQDAPDRERTPTVANNIQDVSDTLPAAPNVAGRRSNRARRAPLPPDADVQLPKKGGAQKRAGSDMDRSGRRKKIK